MQATHLSGGFSNPAFEAARAFRSVMDAIARPGTLHNVTGAAPPAPLSPAAGAVALTLCDTDTPVYLAGAFDCTEVRAWLAFHTGAPLVGRADAMFAFGTWDALLPLSDYRLGTSDYPDRSATLIAEVKHLSATGAKLNGPGIEHTSMLSLPEIDAFQANHAHYPRGLDFILTSGTRIAGVPRSTQVTPCT
ncbi:MAG: phosphonate C-P lyase system protein PhnH [Pseudomonadota bacterium]